MHEILRNKNLCNRQYLLECGALFGLYEEYTDLIRQDFLSSFINDQIVIG